MSHVNGKIVNIRNGVMAIGNRQRINDNNPMLSSVKILASHSQNDLMTMANEVQWQWHQINQ